MEKNSNKVSKLLMSFASSFSQRRFPKWNFQSNILRKKEFGSSNLSPNFAGVNVFGNMFLRNPRFTNYGKNLFVKIK